MMTTTMTMSTDDHTRINLTSQLHRTRTIATPSPHNLSLTILLTAHSKTLTRRCAAGHRTLQSTTTALSPPLPRTISQAFRRSNPSLPRANPLILGPNSTNSKSKLPSCVANYCRPSQRPIPAPPRTHVLTEATHSARISQKNLIHELQSQIWQP